MASTTSTMLTTLFALRRCDASALGPDDLEPTIGCLRRVQRAVDRLVIDTTNRAALLSEERLGPGPDALAVGAGEVSAATARADAARAETARLMPALAGALSDGAIGADHLDAVAAARRKASEVERQALINADAELASAARRLSAESFQRHLSRRMTAVRQSIAPADRGDSGSELRWWVGRGNTGRIAGRLSPEDYERISNALADEMTAIARRAGGARETADGVASPVVLDAHLAAQALVNRVTAGAASGSGRPAITADRTTDRCRPITANGHAGPVGSAASPVRIVRLVWLRPSPGLVPGPPCDVLGRSRPDQPRQPGPALQPTPSHGPRGRMAPGAGCIARPRTSPARRWPLAHQPSRPAQSLAPGIGLGPHGNGRHHEWCRSPATDGTPPVGHRRTAGI